MTAVIDHTALPGIIEKIIDAADFKTQLALRGTSKAYSSHVSKINFKHLRVSTGDGPGGFLKSFRLPHLLIPVSLAGYNVPTLFNATGVVDVRVAVNAAVPIKVLAHLPSAHTIRRMGLNSTASMITNAENVHTVVDFVHTGGSATDDVARIMVSYKFKRYIVHYRWKKDNPVPFVMVERAALIEPHEVIIALWPDNTDGPPPPESAWSFVGNMLSRLTPSVTMKVVGVEKLDSGSNIDASPQDVSDHISALQDALDRRFQDSGNPAQAEETTRNPVTFVTFEHWWKELGENKDIHGVWNPLYDVEVSVIRGLLPVEMLTVPRR